MRSVAQIVIVCRRLGSGASESSEIPGKSLLEMLEILRILSMYLNEIKLSELFPQGSAVFTIKTADPCGNSKQTQTLLFPQGSAVLQAVALSSTG